MDVAQGSNDMDIFVAIQKLDAAGQVVPFIFLNLFDNGPVALGWLRASHRELDPEQSTEYQPVLRIRKNLSLERVKSSHSRSRSGLPEPVLKRASP